MDVYYSVTYMFLISIIIGYWSMSFLINKTSDLTWNLNKFYTALIMSLAMAIAELFMHYAHTDTSSFIVLLVILLSALSYTIYLYMEQESINESQFLRSMIEHHSMAITMSDKILGKPSISKDTTSLAHNIKKTQDKEIELMKKLLTSAKS